MKKNKPTVETEGECLASVCEILRQATVLTPLRHEHLSIFPVQMPDGHQPPYLMLEEALEKQLAQVTEKDQSGSVPELLLENQAEIPVLLLEGDVLIGAKQNRVVNITLLVPPKTQFLVPVSCVERGRWRYDSRFFALKRSAPPELRRSKTKSVLQSKRMYGRPISDQMDVWSKVDACLCSVAADSPTDSLEDSYRFIQSNIEFLSKKMELPAGATGFIVASGDRVITIDLFGEACVAAKAWPRLSESYFMHALGSKKETRKPMQESQAQEALLSLTRAIRLSATTTGLGQELEVQDKQTTGMGLAYKGRLVHLAAFPTD